MNKKRILVFIGAWVAVTVIVIVIFFLSKNNQNDNSSLIASDIAAQNIGEIENIRQNDTSGNIGFFTGSSSATLNLDSKSNDFLKTNLTTKDFPINTSDKVSGYGNRLLTRSIYSESNDVILNAYLGNDKPSTSSDKAWLLIDGESISPAFSTEYANAIDAMVSEKGIYFINSAAGTSSLHFKDLNGNYNTLKSGITAVKIVGTLDNRVYLNDYFGNVFEYDGTTYEQILNNTLSLVVDSTSKKIIFKTKNDSNTGEEGGLIESSEDSSASSSFTIFDPVSGTKTDYSPQKGQSYIAKGFIVTSNNISSPDLLEIYNINTKEIKKTSVDHSSTKVSNQVANLVVASTDPLLVAAITNNNQLVIYADQKSVDKVPEFKLPYVQPVKGQYVFDQNIGDSSVVISTKEADANVVEKSNALLKDGCGCDINQISKSWVMRDIPEGSL